MSQYILFTAKDNTGFCGIEGMPFYQKYAKNLFGTVVSYKSV